MIDILSLIPGKKKTTGGGWTSFNAVCCHHRGHKADRRSRGGLKFEENDWIYHCFNCSFSCGTQEGRNFTSRTKQLLKWLGVDELQIEKWSFESFSKKNIGDPTNSNHQKSINFEYRPLPEGSELLDINNPQHKKYHDYLSQRNISSDDYTFYVTPNATGREKERIIIPYYYNGKLVGNTSRYYDDRKPKYISDQQAGYVFNIDNQKRDWSVCILVEGQFDAISIGGCAFMSNTFSDDQARLLLTLHRKIILVPDRDSTGLAICNRALQYGYQVSIPNWSSDVKDVNDAVKKYGKLPTLISILQNATSSRIKVEMLRKRLV